MEFFEQKIVAQERQLKLYLPGICREITLARDKITLGRNKFRDLDLSRLPDGDYLEEEAGEFYIGNGGWFFKPGKSLLPPRINDRELIGEHRRLNSGDCLVLEGRIVLIIREASLGNTDVDELQQNIQLFFESIHVKNGHVGMETMYDAARRVALQRHWGVVNGKSQNDPPEELPIPGHIRTREALLGYIRKQKPGWRMWDQMPRPNLSRPPVPTAFGEDVLLWLDRDSDVQYVARRGQVRHRKWLHLPGGPEAREQWYAFPYQPATEDAVWQFARENWPRLPHNRNGELDEDILLSNFSDPFLLQYDARTREVTCEEGFKEAHDRLRIPERITTREELVWYVKVRKREWFGQLDCDERLLRDAVLFKRDNRWAGKVIHEETRYLAQERTVMNRSWDDGPNGGEYTAMVPLKIPYDISSFEKMTAYVRHNRPAWMGLGDFD